MDCPSRAGTLLAVVFQKVSIGAGLSGLRRRRADELWEHHGVRSLDAVVTDVKLVVWDVVEN